MLTLIVSLLILAPGHDAVSFGKFEVQAVAITTEKAEYLETCVRTEGELPAKDGWSLKVLFVGDAESTSAPMTQPMTGASDISAGPLTVSGFSPRKSDSVPEDLTIRGELVHYRSIEETATFPVVRLVTQSRGREHGRQMRNWFVPDGDKSTAATDKGLVLHYVKMGGWGYSGPGYDDLSYLPVGIDIDTMNRGVEAELKACRETTVDRVDAYSVPERVRPIYQIVPKTEYGVFSFMDRDFTQDVQLSLHIIRRIVDRRYKFNLTVPVQRNKDMDEGHKAQPDPARIVVWPSSTKPVRTGVPPP